MEVLNDRQLLIKTRHPARITETIKDSELVHDHGDGRYEVAVSWELESAQMLRKLRIKNVPSPILRDYNWPRPIGFEPFDHQRDTASFLTLNKRAFCFNEQGTGKTASVIWAADYLIQMGAVKRVLVVCPLSIMQSAWQQDLFKFAVHRTVGVAYGDAEKRKRVIESNVEFVVINYDGIPAISETLLTNNPFDLIVIDEANAYKNAQTKRWKLMRKVLKPDTWLWMLTGTPAAQSPVDAYGLGRLCVPERTPQFFGDFQEAVMKKVTMYKWEPRPEATQLVFDMLQPAIRYTKKECLDLPLMTYTTREAPLSPQQRKYYKELKNQLLMEAAGEEVSLANAASKMSKLLQISGGAVYSDSGAIIEFDVSNRLQVVQEVIEEASQKVLIFVPFRHTITTLHMHLLKSGIVSECIHGDVTVSDRNNIFRRFQTEDALRVLIIQPQAAAHGVTLTAADTIIWYSPVTSAETYLQANARIDRPGQRHPMTVVHIEGSPIERKLYAMLQNNIDHHERIVDLYKKEMEET